MEQTLLSTQAAGDWLHQAIPGDSPAYWRTALINNRRNDRKPPHVIPFVTMGRGAFYMEEDLQAFANFEKSRRLGTLKLSGRAVEALKAFGIGEAGGSTTGRNLAIADITPQVEEMTGVAFIQLITRDPLMVYRLGVEEARSAAKKLVNAVAVADRMGNDPKPKVHVQIDSARAERKKP